MSLSSTSTLSHCEVSARRLRDAVTASVTLPPTVQGGVLSSECAALVALGDPKDVYAAYESALGTSLLASQLKKFESTLGLPVRAINSADGMICEGTPR